MESRLIPTNGIDLHAQVDGDGPLALLVHGFPGTSFSWRHQLPVLAAAGWQAVAIDTRGYGGSERPADGYTTEVIEQDLLGVVDALGADQAVLIGQDFGSKYAWNLARHHPERVRAVVGTVPFADLSQDEPPTRTWAALGRHHFLHLHYFQAVGVAERDLGGEQVPEFLARLLWALSGDGNYFSVFGHPSAQTSYLDALPPAPPLPWPWLSEAEFATFVDAFASGGPGREFAGGFGSYRAADADWAYESSWLGVPIDRPAMLLIGEHDPVRKFTETDPELFTDLTERVIPGAGHHVQQEQPDAVNAALLEFLARV
ncbi:alpha/beta fold hydrolase [Nocardioides sp. Bht2]|uniref:alpha/beta fold hydrolase n=1 Tax=Nocardioides sp. Bht2 TaxID=3392297 RepID=UPI0039B61291